MSEERDPLLESLFAQAASATAVDTTDHTFVDKVMANVDQRRRNVFIGRIAILVFVVAFEVIFSSPLQNSVGALTEGLSTSLLDFQSEWLASAVAPINSVAGILGLVLIGVHWLYRSRVR